MSLSHPSRRIKDEEDGTALDEKQTAENLSDGSPDALLLPMVQYIVKSESRSVTTVGRGRRTRKVVKGIQFWNE